MLMLWRHSFDVCGAKDIDPKAYLQTHTDMLIHSLRAGTAENTAGTLASK
jgi:hypothetical protein